MDDMMDLGDEPEQPLSNSVDDEFQRYAFGTRSPKATSILKFWQVSLNNSEPINTKELKTTY